MSAAGTLLFGGALISPAPVRALDRQAEEALELDQSIQVLKDEMLQFNRDAVAVEEEYAYPPATRATLYVSVETPGLLIQSLKLDIDGGQPVVYQYSEPDARALLSSKGMHRLGRFNVARGSHRLRVEYTGRYAPEKPSEGVDVDDRLEVLFDKGHVPVELELIIDKANRGGKPILRLKEWRAER